MHSGWIICAFLAVTSAQPPCDPVTQYLREGVCCKMCGPGTSMTSLGSCLEPQCQGCGKNEYQDKYTSEPKCQRQPFCDPNRNFLLPDNDATKQSACMCKAGFHCSSEECITCVPHHRCEPGQGARSKGNQTHDTVCQKCPDGTFSNESSWGGACERWTECGSGQHAQQSGTDVSDRICVKTWRTHAVGIAAAIVGAIAIVIVVLVVYLCKGKRGDAKRKAKDCVESCLGGKREPPRGAAKLITTPTTEDEEYRAPEMPSSHGESLESQPVENDDDQSHMTPTGILLTDNGNLVRQENGKTEILSRQESETLTSLE